jgi:ATP-dependent DNA helicase PIF1
MGRHSLFIVSTDEYQSTEEDESILAPVNWWEMDAKFKPDDSTIAKTMNVDEDLIWRILNGKTDKNGTNHILVSGRSGAGKSHLLERFRDHFPKSEVALMSKKPIGEALVVSAPTGIASINIDGETIHRVLGLGLADESPAELFRTISANRFRYAKTWKFLMDTRILIIDEISMVTPSLFQILDYMFRQARGNPFPFGGVHLIMFGDALQLPSVTKNQSENQVKYFFQTEVWGDMNLSRVYLNRNYRQSDAAFMKLLDEVRFGKLSTESEHLLKSRIIRKPFQTSTNVSTEMKIEPISIFATKKSVEERNSKKLADLAKLGNPIQTFPPSTFVAPRSERKQMNPKEAESGRQALKNPKTLEDKFPVGTLEVCVGAQVMARCNAYHMFGVVNGSMGIVTMISSELISVLFQVKGKFMDKPLDIGRYNFRSKFSDTVDLVMSSYPLCQAWATTIHKVQGLTLDAVTVSGANCFEVGQFYVAISRVRSLEHLTLLNFDRSNIKTDKCAIEFESILNEETETEESEEELPDYSEEEVDPIPKKIKT